MRNVSIVTLVVAVCTGLAACGITDEDLKQGYAGYVPRALEDGWAISTPAAEGFDTVRLGRVMESLHSEDLYPTVHGLLVVRHGRLVADVYPRDAADIHRLHAIQSATKSITSLLTGIALDRGLIGSLDAAVYDFVPQFFDDDVRKRSITLRHALAMETGLEFDNDADTPELVYSKGSSAAFVLSRDLVFDPGTAFFYHDGNPQLASCVLQQVSGLTLEDFAARYLFGPLGITDYRWERHADGSTFGAFGLWLKPRDMAKIGQLLVQDGVWDGVPIVSTEWIAESTAPTPYNEYYALGWWVDPGGAFRAIGHGGQVIHVAPDQDMVIVLTTDPYSSDATLSPGLFDVFDQITYAVMN